MSLKKWLVVLWCCCGALIILGCAPPNSEEKQKETPEKQKELPSPLPPSQPPAPSLSTEPWLLCPAKFEGFSLRSASKAADGERGSVSFEGDASMWAGVTVNKVSDPLPLAEKGEKKVTVAGLPGVLSEDKNIPALYINFQRENWRFNVEVTFRDKAQLHNKALSVATKLAEETALWSGRFLGAGTIPSVEEQNANVSLFEAVNPMKNFKK